MKDPGTDVGSRKTLATEERVHVRGEVLLDDDGDLAGEDNAETLFGDVPTHDLLGVGIKDRAGGQDAGARAGHVFAGHQHSAGAVAEEAGRNEVGDGEIVVLQGEGAEFDRKDHRDLSGEGADVIGGACHARGAGDAAEPEIGTRLILSGSPMRLMSRASMEGLQIPVMETKKMAPRRFEEIPDRSSARVSACSPRSCATSIQWLLA